MALEGATDGRWRDLCDERVPERAASMLKPSVEAVEYLGGSMRVKGEAVRRRLRIPTRLRVGDRPAGAVRGEDF